MKIQQRSKMKLAEEVAVGIIKKSQCSRLLRSPPLQSIVKRDISTLELRGWLVIWHLTLGR